MTRSARQVVEAYNLVAWNERDLGLADELLGQSVIRHGVGTETILTHDEAVARVVDHLAMVDAIQFELELVVAGEDGEHVTIAYQSPITLKDGTTTIISSIEIFRVVDGRITEVWNAGHEQGAWA